MNEQQGYVRSSKEHYSNLYIESDKLFILIQEKTGHCYGNKRAEERCSSSTITCEEKSPF